MKILSQIDTSHEGNDCWIYEEWALIEIFEETFIYRFTKVSDWCGTEREVDRYSINNLNEEITVIYNKLKAKRNEGS